MSQHLHARLLFFALPSLAAVAGWWLVSSRVQLPYMDEPFHVPQAQAYCAGQWSRWDPKITTPPGLYVISVTMLRGLAALVNKTTEASLAVPDWLCSLTMLRLTNTILAIALLALCRQVVRVVAEHQAGDRAHLVMAAELNAPTKNHKGREIAHPNPQIFAWNALNAWLQPIAVLYYWLYYTEPASGVLVLACYLLAHNRWYWLSSTVGFASMLVRQTNLIWMCFAAGTALAYRIRVGEANKKLAPRSPATESKKVVLPTWVLGTCPQFTFRDWLYDHAQFLCAVVRYKFKTLRILSPFAFVIGAGVVLAVANGGLIAGDKDNHRVSVHIPQLFYATVVVFTLCSPIVFTLADFSAYVVFTLRKLRSRRGFPVMAIVFCAMLVFIHYLTYEHPFILSDNRHYAFYFWKNIIRSHWVNRYLLVGVYFLCGWFLYRKLGENQGTLFVSVFVLACALTLVPSPLVEFRYFILPALLFRLHVIEHSRYKLALETLLHLVVNAGVLYMFLERPFEWKSEPGVQQRFMW